jgi:transcriptional regulator with XRE-family HTH domain
MNEQIQEMAMRIRSLREDLGLSAGEMAAVHGLTEEDYLRQESGEQDFSFTFLYNTAQRLGIDMTDLLTGAGPTLSAFTVVRKGGGLAMTRRSGFSYRNLAHRFRHRTAEPFVVEAPFVPSHATDPIVLRGHSGQELDYVLSGRLRFRIGVHETLLEAGDSVYYDATQPHGMVAQDGPCTFLAVVIRDVDGRIG